MWIEPIYDRTQTDVNRVKELNLKLQTNQATEEEILEWQDNLKGVINTSDLQRIINNCNYLSEELGVEIVDLSIPEIPTVSWYATLLSNVQTLIDNYIIHAETPDLPIQPLNTFIKWNIIEKSLWDMSDILSASTLYYCNENDLICNDNILI